MNLKTNIFRLGLLILTELGIIWLYIVPVLTCSTYGFPLDDSWIYAVFARNFVSSGEIAFNLGHPSVGFTSSFWFLLLCFGRLIHLPVVGWSLFLGFVAQTALAAITGSLFHRFLRARFPDLPSRRLRFLAWFASFLVILCGPLIWYSLSGMETTMFLAIGLLAVLFLSRGQYRGGGIALGLLLITRIEGAVLWGLALVYAGFTEFIREKAGALSGRKLIKRLLPLLLLPTVFFILELLKNLCLSRALLPTTFAGRKWLSVPAGGRGPFAYFKLWGYGFRISLLPSTLQEDPLLIIFWLGALILFILSLRLLIEEAIVHRGRISGLFLIFLWGFGHNLVYIIMLPSPSQAGRYQAVNFLLFWILLYLPVASGLASLSAKKRGLVKMFPVAGLSLLLGAILLLDLYSTIKWKEIYLSSVRHINDVHIMVGRWIGNNIPPGSRVAAFDIGALKYFSPETEIVDLGGLVDRDFAGYLSSGRVVDYMKKRRADYLAMVELQNSPGRIFEDLHIRDDPRLSLRPAIRLDAAAGDIPSSLSGSRHHFPEDGGL